MLHSYMFAACACSAKTAILMVGEQLHRDVMHIHDS